MEAIDINAGILTFIFFAGLLAGIVDAVTGGGGLVSIPAMLFVGLPPINAIATEQVQSALGMITSLSYFMKKKLVEMKHIFYFPIISVIGGLLGAYFVNLLSSQIILYVITLVFVYVFFYILFSKNLQVAPTESITENMKTPLKKKKGSKSNGESAFEEAPGRISHFHFGILVLPLLAFYDGFIGIATGLFIILCLNFFLAYNLPKAVSQTKIINLASNLAAVAFFIFFNKIHWTFAIIMSIGSILGNLIGASLVVRRGVRIIRPFLVAVALLASISVARSLMNS